MWVCVYIPMERDKQSDVKQNIKVNHKDKHKNQKRKAANTTEWILSTTKEKGVVGLVGA